MVSSEMTKLFVILGSGLVIGAIGQVIIIKKKKQKKKEQEAIMNNYPDSGTQDDATGTLTKEEETAKNYISQYKTQYPKDAVKQGLLQYGISDNNADKYLEKYF